MDVERFLDKALPEEIIRRIADLTVNPEDASLSELKEFLSHQYKYNSDHECGVAVSRLACRGLLQKGLIGVQTLRDSVLEASLDKYPHPDVGTILETLWYVAHGQLPPKGILLDDNSLINPLDTPPTTETIAAAHQAFYEIVEDSQLNEELFMKLMMFLFQSLISAPEDEKEAAGFVRSVIFEVFTEPAIKITSRLIKKLELLISEAHPEEVYQQFLSNNPVFIDPLASRVIPKQKFGLEHITDFVVRRLDNEYILVEIEKPQDAIFTSGDDLTAKFTHAYGQVIDFQGWVDAHGEYARSLMPGISAPKGMLIIGMRKQLTERQIAKLKRFNINSKSIEVFTYDDLLVKAKDLYENIHTNAKQSNRG